MTDSPPGNPLSPQQIIRKLQEQLAGTNHNAMALTAELEKRIEEGAAALRAAHAEVENKNESLLAANKELEAFSYSVSHDLRAPLRHLMGFAQALVEDCAPRLEEQDRVYLANITRAAQRMNELVEALLTFSRASQQPLEHARVEMDSLVEQIIAELRPETALRRIE